MTRIFNKTMGPVLINNLGQGIDGLTIKDVPITLEVVKGLVIGDLFNVDNPGVTPTPVTQEYPLAGAYVTSGGTVGDVLAKKSGTSGDIGWVSPNTSDDQTGLPLYVTGHSDALGVGIPHSRRWPEQLARKMRLSLSQGAVSGSTVIENSFNLNNGGIHEYGTPRRGVAIVDAVLNSIIVLDSVNPTAAYEMHAKGLYYVLADLSCGARVKATSPGVTTSGTWVNTAFADPTASGGNYAFTTSANAYVEMPYTGKDVYVVVRTSSTGFSNIEIKLDGVIATGYDNYSLNAANFINPFSTVELGNQTTQPVALKIPVATWGAHTIRVTNKSDLPLIFETMLVAHPTPQPIVVVQDPTNLPFMSTPQKTRVGDYNTLVALTAAQFPNATVVDLRTIQSAFVTTDGAHYDDATQQLIADFMAKAVKNVLSSAGARLNGAQDLLTVGGAEAHPVDNQVSKFVQDTASRTRYIIDNRYLVKNSATGARPTADLYIGKPHFDTTLGKPIWYNGTVWKDATGATV